jgi:long-chain acyl-CoA synthetase
MNRDALVRAFDRLVERRPDARVVVSPTRHATAGGVDALSRAAATVLQAAEVPPGRAVGLLAPNGPGFLASLIAVLRARHAAVLLDPRTPAFERDRIAIHLGTVITLRSLRAWPEGPEDFVAERDADAGALPIETDEALVVKLTSGSTGLPRGILTPTEALLADDEALRESMGIGSEDRLLATVPFSHSYGLSSLAIPALTVGIPVVVPDDEGPFSPILAAEHAGATVFPTVPAFIGALLRLSEPAGLPASLRLVISAGAPLSPAPASRFRERFSLPAHVFYGASECGGITYDREGTAAERGTVGTTVEGVGIDLATEEGSGENARVTVRSPSVARGYWPADESRLGDGRYVSDDLAEWRDGELALVGRLNDLINVKGHKVNPREVETVIGELPEVEEVVVLGVPGPGENQTLVRAVIACRDRSIAPESLLAHCRSRLSENKVPRSVVFVRRIPRTERGKIDRSAMTAAEPADVDAVRK